MKITKTETIDTDKGQVKFGNHIVEYENVPYEAVKPIPKKPIKYLTCCCCGNGTTGRQWWNRDTGYGLCNACVIWLTEERGEDEETMRENYGEKGFHYAIEV
jgi:hypothetical protein